MKLSTHLSATMLALPIVFMEVPPPPLNALLLCGVCMGTVAPDADARGKSPIISAIKEIKKAGKKVNLSGLFEMFAVFLSIPGFVVGGILELMVHMLKLRHRGALHTPFAAGVIMILGGVLFPIDARIGIMIIGLAVGWLMHLVLDSLTPSGIVWFGRRISGPIVTSSKADVFLGRALVVLGVVLAGLLVYNQ